MAEFKKSLSVAKVETSAKLSDGKEVEAPIPAIGDKVQWVSQGVAQFGDALPVTQISEDGKWLWVNGSQTAIPIEQIEISEKADDRETNAPPKPMVAANTQTQSGGDPPKPPNAPPRPPMAGTKQDVFALERGQIRVEWPESLSSDEVTDVEEWFPLLLRKIKRSVRAAEQAGGDQ